MKSKKRQPSGTYLSIKNDILRALLNSEHRHLSPKLEQVDLKFGEIIYTADQRIDYVYFPETAVVAMVDTVEDGGTVEVGTIAHEGMVGINIFGFESVGGTRSARSQETAARQAAATSALPGN